LGGAAGRPELLIILSAHAQEMMEERRIELDWVVVAINFPERTEVYAHKTYSFRKIDAFGGRTLKVVHRHTAVIYS
jgi:hypothetical protein